MAKTSNTVSLISAPNRIVWIDIARGIGIILVVFGHVLRGLQASGIVSTSNPIWALDYTIYTFHMPLFFILAGMQVDRSIAKGRWRFLKSKIVTVAYPYLIWSWFQLSLKLLIPRGIANAVHPPITLVTILWAPVEQFWFLFFLFLCHFVAFLVGGNRSLLIAWLSAAVVGSALISQGKILPNTFIKTFCFASAFYLLGILLSKRLFDWRPNVRMALNWSLISFVALLVTSHICRGLSNGRSDQFFSWPVTGAGVLLLISLSHLCAQSARRLSELFGFIGQISMTIYIFHVLASVAVRSVLGKLHVSEWAAQLIVGTVVGIIAPTMLHLLLSRLGLLFALGLGPRKKISKHFEPITVSAGLD